MSDVRLGVIGLGGMGQGMVRRARDLDGVEVTAGVEIAAERRQAAEEEFDISAFRDLDAMLEADLVDAVYIATPNKVHAEQAVRCLQAGVHVFCEKPMAMNAAEGERMIAAAREADRKLTINFSYRATGEARALKSVADAGLLGDVYFARTAWLRSRGIPGKGWFTDRELSGGGPLIDLGVHRIDLALWLMGYPEPVAVSGATYHTLGEQVAGRMGVAWSVEDLATGYVRFADGATLSLACSWATNNRPGEDMFTYVYGTRAGIAHCSVAGTYQYEARMWGDVCDAYGETVLAPVGGPGHLEGFIAAVRGEGPVPVDPEDALKVQRIIDALYQSAETGREVRLAEG